MRGWAIVGLSGSGKSTGAVLLEEYAVDRGWRVERIKLASPLYELQNDVYTAAGVPLAEGTQDQRLLEDLASHIRRINPRALAAEFARRVAESDADVLINDDLRDPDHDAPVLVGLGFRILHVTCAEAVRLRRLEARADVSGVAHSASTARLGEIEVERRIDNSGSLASYRMALHDAIRDLA
jgi:dephospho-CoA kinase